MTVRIQDGKPLILRPCKGARRACNTTFSTANIHIGYDVHIEMPQRSQWRRKGQAQQGLLYAEQHPWRSMHVAQCMP